MKVKTKMKVKVEVMSYKEAYNRFRMPPERPVLQLWSYDTKGNAELILSKRADEVPLICDSCNHLFIEGDTCYHIEDYSRLYCQKCWNTIRKEWDEEGFGYEVVEPGRKAKQ
jgi:hypothetical protein